MILFASKGEGVKLQIWKYKSTICNAMQNGWFSISYTPSYIMFNLTFRKQCMRNLYHLTFKIRFTKQLSITTPALRICKNNLIIRGEISVFIIWGEISTARIYFQEKHCISENRYKYCKIVKILKYNMSGK